MGDLRHLAPASSFPAGCLNCSKVSELTERLKALEAKVGERQPLPWPSHSLAMPAHPLAHCSHSTALC